MSLLKIIKTEDINVLKSGNPVFLFVDGQKQPVLMVTVSGDQTAADLSGITTALFEGKKIDMAFFDVPANADSLKQNIDLLFSKELPVDENNYPHEEKEGRKKKCKPIFTNREIQILQMIAMEYTNEEIADKLCLAKRTVDNHRVNLMQRVNAKNTAGLIGYAFRNGLVV
jgi:DNA-binding NarL/FixJ family response regulator